MNATIPEINNVKISPNPVNVNANFLISVGIIEKETPVYKVENYLGVNYSNQAIRLQKKTTEISSI